MATIKARVISVLGQDNATYLDDINDLNIIFEEGIWDTAQAMPTRLMLTRCSQPLDPSTAVVTSVIPGDGESVKESLVLLVMRTKANSDATPTYDKKYVKEIPYEESHKALDSSSIYYATDYSPVWWKQNKAGLPVLNTAPLTNGETIVGTDGLSTGRSGLEIFEYKKQHLGPTTVVAWAHTTDYIIGDFTSVTLYGTTLNFECLLAHASTDDTNTETGTPSTNTNWRQVELWDAMVGFNNIPEELEDIIIKRIAMKCLDQKIANIGIQDEDNEVFTLLGQARGQIAEELKGGLMMVQRQWGEKEIRGDKK